MIIDQLIEKNIKKSTFAKIQLNLKIFLIPLVKFLIENKSNKLFYMKSKWKNKN